MKSKLRNVLVAILCIAACVGIYCAIDYHRRPAFSDSWGVGEFMILPGWHSASESRAATHLVLIDDVEDVGLIVRAQGDEQITAMGAAGYRSDTGRALVTIRGRSQRREFNIDIQRLKGNLCVVDGDNIYTVDMDSQGAAALRILQAARAEGVDPSASIDREISRLRRSDQVRAKIAHN